VTAVLAGSVAGIRVGLDRPYGGSLAVFGDGHAPRPERVTSGLGERWETERITVKPSTAEGGLHAAIDAARQRREEVAPSRITGVDIAMGAGANEHGGWRPERSLTAPLLPDERRHAIEGTILGIEELDDLSTLTDLLTPGVPPALA
jgi:hypothetical protein